MTDRLRTQGHQVLVLSRRSQPYAVDLRDGTGLDAAVDGVDAIMHCATTWCRRAIGKTTFEEFLTVRCRHRPG